MGRVVVVTGGSAGVGFAVAERFARKGDAVAILARGDAGLAAAKTALRDRARAPVLALAVDVSDANAVEQAAATIERSLGPIDVWVNGAMVTVFAPVADMTAEEYRRVTEVTYLGAVHGTLAALKHMRPRNRGVVIQVGSALAYRSIPLQSAYCAAKFAVRGFTDSLRTELMHDGSHVRITMVQLPAVNTPQFDWARNKLPMRPMPVPPIFAPEVPAAAVTYAASHDRREIFVGWPAIKAILGAKFAPAYADRVLARMGYQSQEADEPRRERADNLMTPVAHPRGPRGRFVHQEKRFSLALWLDLNREAIAGTIAAVSLAVLARRLGQGASNHEVPAKTPVRSLARRA